MGAYYESLHLSRLMGPGIRDYLRAAFALA